VNIKLVTADGGFVGYATIPPFTTRPEVIMWGSRVFKLTGHGGDNGQTYGIYREVFTFALVGMTRETL
jgi:hypothetical protein